MSIAISASVSNEAAPLDQALHDNYANMIVSFASRTNSALLHSGEHYRTFSQFLMPLQQPIPSINTTNQNHEAFPFVVVHQLVPQNGGRRRTILEYSSPKILAAKWKELKNNRIVILRGYPSQDWISHLGVALDIDHEFFYQHFSNSFQLSVAENYCLPPLSLISAGTLQLTLTSIGSWDNHRTGSNLAVCRRQFGEEMVAYQEFMSTNGAPSVGNSIVRSFRLHDVNHFSIEQKMTIKLIRYNDFWTVLIWIDNGNSLNQSHHGPWLAIQRQHSSATRFLPIPLHYSKSEIKKISAASAKRRNSNASPQQSAHRLEQTLSYLYRDLGESTDPALTAVDPFYSLDEVFRLHAASEHQFLNLMEEKAQDQGLEQGSHQRSISELHTIKRLVDQHKRRLGDTLKFITARGDSSWARPDGLDKTQVQKADAAARKLVLTYQSLIQDAEDVSGICVDEMTMLSNEAVVHEAQKSIEQAEKLGKISFLAFIFVPLTFATSIYGMNFREINGQGHSIWIFVATAAPVLLCSLLAWWFDASRRQRLWRAMRNRRPRQLKRTGPNAPPGTKAEANP